MCLLRKNVGEEELERHFMHLIKDSSLQVFTLELAALLNLT